MRIYHEDGPHPLCRNELKGSFGECSGVITKKKRKKKEGLPGPADEERIKKRVGGGGGRLKL